MDRRSLVMATFAAVGSSVAGCLEYQDATGEPNDSQDTDGGDDTDMNDSLDSGKSTNGDETDDGPADSTDDGHEYIRETNFEVLGTDYEFDRSASVAFDSDAVTVRGTIMGNNTCYTAKLDEVTTENRTLLMNVESFEDADEGEGCGEATIGIDYQVVFEFDGDPPSEVTVKHNGQHVTTEQAS